MSHFIYNLHELLMLKNIQTNQAKTQSS